MTDKQAVHITIPEGVTIESLEVKRNPTNGNLSFSWAPIEAICAASGIDMALFRDNDEGNVAYLLVHWYAEHLNQGGLRNDVLERLIAESELKLALGEEIGGRGDRAL
jgi:hypothetical protein